MDFQQILEYLIPIIILILWSMGKLFGTSTKENETQRPKKKPSPPKRTSKPNMTYKKIEEKSGQDVWSEKLPTPAFSSQRKSFKRNRTTTEPNVPLRNNKALSLSKKMTNTISSDFPNKKQTQAFSNIKPELKIRSELVKRLRKKDEIKLAFLQKEILSLPLALRNLPQQPKN